MKWEREGEREAEEMIKGGVGEKEVRRRSYRISGHDLEVGVCRFQHSVKHIEVAVGEQLKPLSITLREELLYYLQ